MTLWDYLDKHPNNAVAFGIVIVLAIFAFATAFEGRRR